MFTTIVALMGSTLCGALAGGVTGWWAGRQRQAQLTMLYDLGLDPDLDQQITEAARQWAMHQGQPAAASLLADKLRLVHMVRQRPRRRRRWRWSR
jgi:hypothetical protein